jgi:uncharacterized protein (TIGR02453 family)
MTTIPESAFSFFDDLAANNSTTFWAANKEWFSRDVKAPFELLLAKLEPEFGTFKVFRMHRDTRFSADKSPLKTMYGAVDLASGLRYLHIDKDGLLLANGLYVFSKDQLQSWRAAIADGQGGVEFTRTKDELARLEINVGPGGLDPLSGIPRGFPADHPRGVELRWKGCMVTRRINKTDAVLMRLSDGVRDFWHATGGLHDWLRQALRQ